MPTPEQDPRVYFAAERTLLAWIRTGLGLMGVGFAVARFGIFLRGLHAVDLHSPIRVTGFSVWAGFAIVVLGVIVLAASVVEHFSLIRRLSHGTWQPGHVSRNAVFLAALLALVGLAMAGYLLIFR